MRNNKGITLTVLVITVIVLTILTGIVVDYRFNGMNDVTNNKLATQLGIVRQAIIEQYEQAKAVGKINVPISESPVSYWVGERIDDFSAIQLPNQAEISLTAEVEEFYQKGTNYNCQYQEDYYYRLTPENLVKIGISDSKDTYIVNYSTGEVYNETKKVNKELKLLYLPAIKYDINIDNTGDKESFNDWTEDNT